MKVVVRPEPKLPLTLQTENKAQPDFLTLLCDTLYKATCGNIGQMERLVPPPEETHCYSATQRLMHNVN